MSDGNCPNCGFSYTASSSSGGRDLPGSRALNFFKNSLSTAAIIVFLAFLVLNTAILIWSVGVVLPETQTNSTILYVVLIDPIGVWEITGTTFAVYFIGLVSAILGAFFLLLYQGLKPFILFFKDFASKPGKDSSNLESPLLRLTAIFTALMFITQIYYMIVHAAGGSPSSSGLSQQALWVILYTLARAAVWEELVIRVAFLGVPMLIYGVMKGRKKLWRYLWGGFDFKERFVVVPILISSLLFAVAHLGSWDYYKLIPTFIAGLAFGYLFTKDGLHSAILLHFAWDYLSVPGEVFDIPNYDVYISIVILFWMAVGVYYTYHFTKEAFHWLGTPLKSEQEVKTGQQHEPEEGTLTAGVTVGYVCPNCGYNIASYMDKGKLRCKRCGTESDPVVPASQRRHDQSRQTPERQWPPK